MKYANYGRPQCVKRQALLSRAFSLRKACCRPWIARCRARTETQLMRLSPGERPMTRSAQERFRHASDVPHRCRSSQSVFASACAVEPVIRAAAMALDARAAAIQGRRGASRRRCARLSVRRLTRRLGPYGSTYRCRALRAQPVAAARAPAASAARRARACARLVATVSA
jgi:hypothetical protein